jgi:tetratricopeptide (TPR) repeat protein
VEERLYESYVRGDDKDRTIRSLLDLGDLLSRKAEPQRAEACLCKALQVADETGARFCMAEVLCRLGQLRRERRDFAEALRCLGSARAIFGEFADEVGLERVESSLYDYELRTGRFDEAAETLTRCLERRFGCATEWPARADGSVDGVRAVAAERESVRRRERQEELENGLEAGGIRLPAMEVLELVEIWRKSGNIERAFRLLESSLGNEEFKARAETRALATEALGRLALVRGDVELALKSFEQSLNPRSGPPSQDRVATAYLEVGGVLLLRGRLARALDYTLKGLRLALARGSVESCLDGLLALGDLLFEVGEDRAAGRIGAAAANLARSRGAFDRELVAVCQAGRSLRRTGADGPARRAFLRAWEIDRAIAAPLERCRYALEDGWEHFVRGDMARAASAASAGVELARAIGAQRYVPDFWHLAGVVEGCSRNPHNNLLRALELLERVHQDAEANGRPRLAWEVSLAIALIYAGRGKSEIAEAYRQRAEKSRVLCFASLPAELSGLCWSTRHRAEDFS